jgi:Rrf2 family protein
MNDLRTILKREESYAIHALLFIAEHPGTHAAEIATGLQMPPAFMAKVLRKLVTAGFVESQMGRNGGVKLRVDLEEITLLDVIEKVSGPLVLDTCQIKERCATQERQGYCGLKLVWLSTTVQLRDLLGGIVLAQLLNGAAGPRHGGEQGL